MNSAAVCPYCRGSIEADGEPKVCEGCGTPHHADCYEENGGCTIFGCSCAPADEPEVSISRTELSNTPRTPAPMTSTTLGLGLGAGVQLAATPAPVVAPIRVKAPPPPMLAGAATSEIVAPPQITPRAPTWGAGSVLFGMEPVSSVASGPPAAEPAISPDLAADADRKNRTTFIVLGVLLGFLGAHNFYAGFKRKAIAQLCITLFSLGFAIPMIWVWAVIDVCTVNRDGHGRHFRS
jgi:TM2 domain-containing membrane protein YozV